MELKEGLYVRYKDFSYDKEVKIGRIEAGDYVNGYRVLGFNYDEDGNIEDISVNTYEDVEQNKFTFFIEEEEIEP